MFNKKIFFMENASNNELNHPNTKTESKLFFSNWFSLFYVSVPEILSSALLVLLPIIVDLYFVSTLKNTNSFKALGISNNFLYLFFKLAESIAVVTTTKTGFFNGSGDKAKISSFFFTTIFVAIILGFFQVIFIFSILKIYLSLIYQTKEVCQEVTTFLQLQSIAIFFSFIFMVLVGFLRGLKNSLAPMIAFFVSVAIFLFFDYLLILGKFGAPKIGLNGSAIASIFRYLGGSVFLIIYILTKKKYKNFFKHTEIKIKSNEIVDTLKITLPIMLDKSIIAIAYLWLYKLLAPLGQYSLLTIEVIKNLERLAFVPALGLAQATTCILSNNFGENNISAIWSNLKKILITTIFLISMILILFYLKASVLVGFFDPESLFKADAVFVLRIISPLVIFDICQTIFAAALRATGNASIVMWTRGKYFFFFYVPVSYFISKLKIYSLALKILLIYGSFYVTISIIGISFIHSLFSKIKTKEE